eukprot:CAMPEP_0197077876 /NCGR_PEP_ID=MMETSP1384-20130603/212840_1 /TAXON_ID=29189 /ORGANISM="Ammonia sp." /LENGTH=593 /DNA_ID=CAMNT_0042516741 /DNA_START=94 /DNA_END=1875 /DNA_ORIENTATION=-
MASEHNTAVIITVVIFCVIYLPLSIYQITRLYKFTYRKRTPIECLQKRQTALSLVCCIAYTVQFIDLSLWSTVYADWWSTPDGTGRRAVIFASEFIHLLTQYTLSFCIVLRFWLLHFTVKYEMISVHHHWKKIINPDYQMEERKTKPKHRWNGPSGTGPRAGAVDHEHISNTEWIIANKNRWGNLRFCLKTVGIVFIVLFIAICVAQSRPGTSRIVSSMITYAIFLLMWTLLIAIYCRTPAFYDHIYVRKEIKYLFHIMIMFFFVYILFAFLFGYNNIMNDEYPDIKEVYSRSFFPQILLLFHFVALSNIITIHIFTYLPISKLQHFERSGKLKKTSTLNRTLKKLSFGSHDDHNTEDKWHHEGQNLRLEDVLKSSYGFSSFMAHLAHEFSSELLLSVTEFSMYKKYLYDNVLNMVGFGSRNQAMRTVEEEATSISSPSGNTQDLLKGKTDNVGKDKHKASDIYSDVPYVVLPFDSLPHSAIVFNEELSNKEKAYLLYKKYIEPGAEFEVNIDGGLRHYYRTTLGNKREWTSKISAQMTIGELADLFDKCNDINMGLMAHSFMRFKQDKKEWRNVVKAIMKKQSIETPENIHI